MKAACLAVIALACAPALGANSLERSAPADPQGEVEIGNFNGEVQVLGWERHEVQVTATLGRGVKQLDFEQDGRRTVVKVVVPTDSGSYGSSDLVVRVPQASSLLINTVSADQTIREVRGPQRLQSVSGNIVTEVWKEEFEIQTISGDITAKGHGGPGLARITTISGNVRLDGTGPELELGTTTGDMDIRLERLARGRISTTNGSLELETELAPQGRIEVQAINGDLSLFLRGSLDAQFDIETFNGDIANCFGHKPRRVREFGPGNQLRFQEGSGSARVRVKTLNGSVEVCKK